MRLVSMFVLFGVAAEIASAYVNTLAKALREQVEGRYAEVSATLADLKTPCLEFQISVGRADTSLWKTLLQVGSLRTSAWHGLELARSRAVDDNA